MWKMCAFTVVYSIPTLHTFYAKVVAAQRAPPRSAVVRNKYCLTPCRAFEAKQFSGTTAAQRPRRREFADVRNVNADDDNSKPRIRIIVNADVLGLELSSTPMCWVSNYRQRRCAAPFALPTPRSCVDGGWPFTPLRRRVLRYGPLFRPPAPWPMCWSDSLRARTRGMCTIRPAT